MSRAAFEPSRSAPLPLAAADVEVEAGRNPVAVDSAGQAPGVGLVLGRARRIVDRGTSGEEVVDLDMVSTQIPEGCVQLGIGVEQVVVVRIGNLDRQVA